MQHSKTSKNKGASAMDEGQYNPNLVNTSKGGLQDVERPPDYFGIFNDDNSQNKDNSDFQSYWKLDFGNDNEENFDIVGQVVNSLGIHSDDEDGDNKIKLNLDRGSKESHFSQKINIEDAKFKSIKPKNKIIRKNLEQQRTFTNLKNPKETNLKVKLKNKGIVQSAKFGFHDMAGIVKTESKETFPNTSDGTFETRHMETHEFNKSGPFKFESSMNQSIENSKMEDSLDKPKTKSQLSLKSKEYTKTSNIKNLHKGNNNSFDNMQNFNAPYHRYSLPHRSLEFAPNLYHFTPSTNYTIPSSDEKRSGHGHPMNPNLSMHILSPVPFEKNIHSNSQEAFNTLDSGNYASYSREGLISSNNYFNNTTPLPNMASFTQRVSCSPALPYYNVNSGSSGRISVNSDFFQAPQSQLYYESSMGKSWPKIPQSMTPQPSDHFSTIPNNYKNKGGRVITRENDEQKGRYKLNFERIMKGEDKRTCLMIRNIPNKYSQTMLTKELDENHKGLYDIIYLPIDPKNKCNCGYAFINLVHPYVILSLFKEFNGKSWRNFNSEKICELSYGRLQGKVPLLKQLEGSGVMQQSDPTKKPLILDATVPPEDFLERLKEDFKEAFGFP